MAISLVVGQILNQMNAVIYLMTYSLKTGVVLYSERPKIEPSGFQIANFPDTFWVRFLNSNKMTDHSKTGQKSSSFHIVLLA
jgi:hypothetical protein